ncbi:DNA cytosine methyltransferase [Bacillus sp. BGMRC 2118]|nr:DNA cytosine methyltransferase [Bacillus sp. BGMRC 2118]
MKKKIKVLDLFAGGGGFSTGFQLAHYNDLEYEIVKALEINDDACRTLEKHLGKEKVFKGDITNPIVKEKLIYECNDVDMIIGGPPCQTFSLAGPARSGTKEMREALKNDPRNTLYKHFFDLVNKIKPKFVVFENVVGIASKKVESEGLSNKESQVIELICDELDSMGYKTEIGESFTERYQILNAADYGVPQYRKRIIILANKLDLINPVPEKIERLMTVRDAISHLPLRLPIISKISLERIKNNDIILKNLSFCISVFLEKIFELIEQEKDLETKSKLTDLYITLIPEYEKIKNRKSYKLHALEKFLSIYNEKVIQLCLDENISANSDTIHSSRQHNFRDIIIFILTKQGSNSSRFIDKKSSDYNQLLSDLYPYNRNKHKDTYVKHSWDRPSNTILAHMEKDGLKFIHPVQPRTYTPYEAALIQSFPKDYSFSGGRNAQYRQIGNAVPPLMAKAIAISILKLIDDNRETYDVFEDRENETKLVVEV